jgi:hypothetical protein
MKKLLLLSLALGLTFYVCAQRNYQVKPEYRTTLKSQILENTIGQEPFKQAPLTISKFVRPASSHHRDLVIFALGQAANAYTYASNVPGGQKTILWLDNEINTFINLHREIGGEPNYSGNLNIDITTDRGDNFTNNVRIYTSTISGGTYNVDAARYPQGGIYNPEGNTNLADAYYAFFAPNLDGTNSADSWGGYSYGVSNLVDFTDTTKHLRSSDPANDFYQYIPDGFTVTHQGTAIATDLNQDWSSGALVYMNSILASRATWDDTEHDFLYDRFLIDYTTLPDVGRPGGTRVAFGPNGMIGYIVSPGDDGSVPFSQGAYYPIVYKTTDAGETWEDPVGVEIGGPDGIDAIVYDWLTDQQLLDFFGEPVPARDEILYTTAFDCDVVVDIYNNPHIAVVVGIGDGAYAIYTPADYIAVFDITSFDGGQTWDAYLCGTLTTFRGTFGDIVDDNRVGASITEDGTRIIISWLDTHFEGVTDNIQPDIFNRGIDIVNCLMTEDAVNVTEYSEAWLQAYLFAAPHYLFVDGDTYTVPYTYLDMDPADPTLPVTFMFIKNFSYTQADFVVSIPCEGVLTANAGPDAAICEGETYTLASAIATNYTSLEWTTSGDGTFNDNTLLNPVYTPGAGDIASGTVTLTLTAFAGSNQVSDDMVLTIDPLPGIPATPEGPDTVDYYYNHTSDFTTAGAEHADSYVWNLQPDSLGTISGNTTTATADWTGLVGTAYITVKAVNDCGESDFSEAWMVIVDNSTGIAEVQDKDIAIRIMPNPNSGEFIIGLTSKDHAVMNLRIMDALGNTVYHQNGIQVAASLTMKLTLNNLRKGVYFILVDDGKTTQAQKLVIQK